MSETLFDKYGGFTTFSSVVSKFYRKILDSDELAPYFEGINMERLMSHQTNFIATALGGPPTNEAIDLKKVHAPFNITIPHFDEIADLLSESLEESGVSDDDNNTIMALISSLMDQIVSSKN